ncbi:peptidylprolyl isomerase fpr3 [Blastocladiella emersonii ATCC 22665]|nr:peptidylprolyl isomerase fpr3 [Blastocladiella emersonii ATCC 22665]
MPMQRCRTSPQATMSFLGVEITKDSVFETQLPAALRLTMAALPHKLADKNGRSTLSLATDDNEFVPVCSLIAGKVEQQALDIELEPGCELRIKVEGANPISLSGYFSADQDEVSDGEDDEEHVHGSDCDHDDEEEESEDEEEAAAEAAAAAEAEAKKQKAAAAAEAKKKADKAAAEAKKKAAAEKAAADAAAKKAAAETESKKRKAEESAATEKEAKKPKAEETVTLKGGLKYVNLTAADATAPKAKAGQTVQMRYIGKLTNGKVFDSNTKGAPFSFKLGRGEVIAGWDQGIPGMAVGQRRKLTIPPKMAYGARGAPPDIPPNATLEFEVKLLGIRNNDDLAAAPMFTQIPVLDVSRLYASPADRAAFCEDPAELARLALTLRDACENVGFFLVTGHGVDPAPMFREARRFFSLPLATKHATTVANNRGYFGIGAENLNPETQTGAGDLKEGLDIGPEVPYTMPEDASAEMAAAIAALRKPNKWVSEQDLPGFRAAAMDYYARASGVADVVLRVLAVAMGQRADFFHAVGGAYPFGQLRLVRYPAAAKADAKQLGCGAHSDYGCITVLAADAPGLQVYLSLAAARKYGVAGSAETEVRVPVVAGAFVVNVADMVSRWTNKRFKSTLHRVVHVGDPEADRVSIPLFYDVDLTTEVRVLPEFLPGGKLADPRETVNHFPEPITVGEHFAKMFASTFIPAADE